MTVRLRAHHLLCLLTYAGHGYTPAFTANLDAVCVRLAAGEAAELVEGPDDVCAPMLGVGHHCEERRLQARDDAALADIGPRLPPGRPFALDADLLGRLREGFRDGAIRGACSGCDWHDLCSGIAIDGYSGTRLPDAGPAPRTTSPSDKPERPGVPGASVGGGGGI